MYKIGLLCHIGASHNPDYYYILCLDGTRFAFYAASYKLIPREYRENNVHYREVPVPVLCQTNSYNVVGIRFLPDFPVCTTNKTDDFYYSLNRDSATLMYQGKPYSESITYSETEIKILDALTRYVVATMQIRSSNATIKFISANDDPYQRERNISQFIKHINSCDIIQTLNSLYVEVTDYYRSKVGDDDSYYIYRTARLQDDTIQCDSYIKQLIGLGERIQIYKDSGYTNQLVSYARDFLKIHPIGIYEGEVLEAEKQRIIKSYSREAHMAYLFYEQLDKQKDALQTKSKWENIRLSAINELYKDFAIDKLTSIDDRFVLAHQFDSELGNLLNSLSNYVYRIQRKLPTINIVISGNIPSTKSTRLGKRRIHGSNNYTGLYYDIIGKIISDLSEDYFVNIITGNADGAEHIALNFAMRNAYKFDNRYTDWTMLCKEASKERAYEMAQLADIIYLTGDPNHYLSKNLTEAANELNKPIRYFEFED